MEREFAEYPMYADWCARLARLRLRYLICRIEHTQFLADRFD